MNLPLETSRRRNQAKEAKEKAEFEARLEKLNAPERARMAKEAEERRQVWEAEQQAKAELVEKEFRSRSSHEFFHLNAGCK
jgi:hypothetical protein